MNCVDCCKEFEEKEEEKEVFVTLNNPGRISAKTKVVVCPNCKQHYSSEEEAMRLMDLLEDARIKQEAERKEKL